MLVHGHCPRGADKLADDVGREMGLDIERHPADWGKYHRGAGMIRNMEMVKLGADVCLAFPTEESVGTIRCMDAARKAGIPVKEFSDDSIPPKPVSEEDALWGPC